MWPAGRIALRSLSEMPITLPPLRAIFSSSPTVLTSRCRGEAPSPLAPSSFTASSPTLVTTLPVSRSYHSLPTMPLIDGVAPDRKVLWHRGHRRIGGVAGIREDGASGEQAFETRVVVAAKARQIIVAELVHHDGQHQFGRRRGHGKRRTETG